MSYVSLNRCDGVYLAVRAEGHDQDQVKTDSYITVSQSRPEPQVQEEGSDSELDVLKVQLRQAEETAHWVQREVPAVTHI